jgi:hypothetical protein
MRMGKLGLTASPGAGVAGLIQDIFKIRSAGTKVT